MSIEPEEHDYIAEVIAEDANRRVIPRLSDDPAVRLAECRGDGLANVQYAKATFLQDANVHYAASTSDIKSAFNEAAERAKFEDLCERQGLEYDRFTEYAGEFSGKYVTEDREQQWTGWLACAKSRAEVK